MIKTILITGGLGFIGYNLSNKLIDKSYKVFILDSCNKNSGYNEFHKKSLKKRGALVIEDKISNIKKYKNILDKTDAVFNLAALISHVKSMKNPINDIQQKGIKGFL